jgi:hypothetical protein
MPGNQVHFFHGAKLLFVEEAVVATAHKPFYFVL